MTQRAHIAQLDGLRGLAILLVTLYRFGRELPATTTGNVVAQVFQFGSRGVELFFVLSGFLITGILLDSRGQPNQLTNFFARRSLRILPLYFAALLLFLWVVPAIATLCGASSLEQAFQPARDQQMYLWLYLTNVQMALVDRWCFGPLDHFWSLAVEEHFYLLWPFVIVAWCPKRIISLTLALIALCVVSRTAWLISNGTATAAEVLTVWRCDGLLLGALAAMLIRSSEASWSRTISITRWIAIPILVMAIVIDASDRRVWMIHASLWNMVWFCLLVNIMASSAPSYMTWFFKLDWLRSLGKLSYGMYVFQSPLIPIVAAIGWSAGQSLPIDWLYVPVMFALTVGIAWCSWHGFEKHCLRWKEYFPQSSNSPAEATSEPVSEATWRRLPASI